MIDETLFWEKVDRRGDEECWPWTGGIAGCGAGIVYIGQPVKTTTTAHRVAWELSGREIPPRVHLRQECGDRLCVNPLHMKLLTPEARFWTNVDMADPSGCWPWTLSTGDGGYGRVKMLGATRPAHRMAWEFQNGRPMPRGSWALHTCDNPPCCRPSHVFPGTPADNVADMMAKGRYRRTNVKLTKAEVLEIRTLQGLEVGRIVAARFGVCTATVHHIWRRATWRQLEPVS